MFKQSYSDALEGVIRNPIQQEGVVGRALCESVCSLPSARGHNQRADCEGILCYERFMHALD